MKKAQSCGICYKPIELQGETNDCKHEFCFSCIMKWAEIENTCPICKRRFTTLTQIWRRKNLKVAKRGAKKSTVKVDSKNQLESQFEASIRALLQRVQNGNPIN